MTDQSGVLADVRRGMIVHLRPADEGERFGVPAQTIRRIETDKRMLREDGHARPADLRRRT